MGGRQLRDEVAPADSATLRMLLGRGRSRCLHGRMVVLRRRPAGLAVVTAATTVIIVIGHGERGDAKRRDDSRSRRTAAHARTLFTEKERAYHDLSNLQRFTTAISWLLSVHLTTHRKRGIRIIQQLKESFENSMKGVRSSDFDSKLLWLTDCSVELVLQL